MKRLSCLAINPQWFDEFFLSFPLGLATIVAIAKEEGAEVEVIDFDAQRIDDSEKAEFLSKRNTAYDIILISGMITNYRRVRKLIEITKLVWPKSKIILGGSLSSTAPEEILKNLKADIFVIGEGDETIRRIIRAINVRENIKKIPGIKFIEAKKVITTAPPDSPPDITVTPRPAYEYFPIDKYIDFLNITGRGFETYTSKGCGFGCIFCYRISGRKIRYRPVDSLINEIKLIKYNYAVEKFSFEDDNFGLNRKWLSEFCAKIKDLKIKFRFQANSGNLDENQLDILQNAGLDGISLGIESGSQSILRELGKNIDLSMTEKLIATLRKRNIKYNATFIVGSPSENNETVIMTKDFLGHNCFTDNFQVFFLTPYPKSPLYLYARKKGIIKDEIEYIENLKLQNLLSVNLTQYSDERLNEWRKFLIGPKQDSGATWTKKAIRNISLSCSN